MKPKISFDAKYKSRRLTDFDAETESWLNDNEEEEHGDTQRTGRPN